MCPVALCGHCHPCYSVLDEGQLLGSYTPAVFYYNVWECAWLNLALTNEGGAAVAMDMLLAGLAKLAELVELAEPAELVETISQILLVFLRLSALLAPP